MSPARIAVLITLLLTVLAGTIIVPHASAQGTDFPVWDGLGAAACDENRPAVAYNEDLDQYLVVFQRNHGALGDWDLSAVRVSSTGSSIGSPFTVAGTFNDEVTPAIARNPTDNNYLVIWAQSNSTPGYLSDIWGVLVEHDGTVGTPFSIAAYPDSQYEPDVAYSVSAGRYLVVWDERDESVSTTPDVWGRCVDTAGNLIGSPLGIGATVEDEKYPAVATNEFDATWLVVWEHGPGAATIVKGRKISPTGLCGAAAPPFTVSSHADGARDVSVAWGQVDPDTSAWGEFLVAWTGNAQPWEVRSRRVDGKLYSVLGSNIEVSTSQDYIYDTAVVYAPDYREWWIVWDEYQNPGPTFVRGQRVLPNGQTPGSRSNHRVSKDPAGYPPSAQQINPALAYGPLTHDALVVWADNGHYSEEMAGEWGLWGRHWKAAVFADGFEDGDLRQWPATTAAAITPCRD